MLMICSSPGDRAWVAGYQVVHVFLAFNDFPDGWVHITLFPNTFRVLSTTFSVQNVAGLRAWRLECSKHS